MHASDTLGLHWLQDVSDQGEQAPVQHELASRFLNGISAMLLCSASLSGQSGNI